MYLPDPPYTLEQNSSLFSWHPQRRLTPPNQREPHFVDDPLESPSES